MNLRDYVPLETPVQVGDIAVFGYDFGDNQPVVGRTGPSQTMVQYQRSAWESGAEAFTDEQIKKINEVVKPLIEERKAK